MHFIYFINKTKLRGVDQAYQQNADLLLETREISFSKERTIKFYHLVNSIATFASIVQ